MLRFICIFLLCAPGAAFAQYTEEQIRTAITQVGGAEIFIQEMARETAAKLPMKTNANIELLSVAAFGKQLKYLSRFVDLKKSSVRDIEELRKSNINYVGCRSPVIGLLIREYDAEISYVVASKDNEFLFEYQLNRKTCANR